MHIHRKGGNRPISNVAVGLTSSVPTYGISIGELLAMVAAVPTPAVSFTWDTNEATTRAGFVAAFLGVSMSRSRIGTTDSRDLLIQVQTDGYFQVELNAAATVVIGDKLGPAKASGNALLNTCKVVSAENEACFVAVEAGTSVTSVLAQIRNTILDRVSI